MDARALIAAGNLRFSEPPDGRVWIGLAEAAIPVERAHAFLSDERAGGVAVFVGTTRRWTEGEEGETLRLYYDAYVPLSRVEMERLGEEATARWPVLRAVLLHRLGTVEAGEASVFVGAACPHRAEAFEACRWLIDALKARVPIWKREEHADGAATWVDSYGPLLQ